MKVNINKTNNESNINNYIYTYIVGIYNCNQVLLKFISCCSWQRVLEPNHPTNSKLERQHKNMGSLISSISFTSKPIYQHNFKKFKIASGYRMNNFTTFSIVVRM